MKNHKGKWILAKLKILLIFLFTFQNLETKPIIVNCFEVKRKNFTTKKKKKKLIWNKKKK